MRLVRQWLSEGFGQQFIENPIRPEHDFASEALRDKLTSSVPRRGALIGVIGFTKERSPKGYRSPELSEPAACPGEYWEPFQVLANVALMRLPAHGLARACINLGTGRAEVMLDDVPGSIELVSTDRIARAAQTRRLRSLTPRKWTEARAWYGLGVPKGSPVEVVERLRGEIDLHLTSPCSPECSPHEPTARQAPRC
jgi:hypothetical protein